MIELILSALISFLGQTTAVAGFKPCIVPNPCGPSGGAQVELKLAGFKPCIGINGCGPNSGRA